jgi:murein DD-endopeptidase MepM/ murein hydrolase activator NlpD
MSLPHFSAPQPPPFPVGSTSLLQSRMAQPMTRPAGAEPIAGALPTKQEAASGSTPPLEQVSHEFEALLLSFVFKAMRQTVPRSGFLGKARDRDWYADLFDFELAKSFTYGKSVGLSAYLQQDLQRLQGRQEQRLPPGPQSPSIGHSPESAPPREARSPTATPPFEAPIEAIILPVIGQLSSHYGERSDPFTGEAGFHRGIDIASPIGTEIRAALPGTVTFSGWIQGYGHMVILSHANGYTTHYAHNHENLVQEGERVSRGQPIALVGQSGRATGPHVHFEVRKDGRSINPMPLLAHKAAV